MGLWQLLLTLTVVTLLLGATLPMAVGVFETMRLQATLTSATAVAQAAREFYQAEGAWPGSLMELQGRWLPGGAAPSTAWGAPLAVTASRAQLTVEAPAPLAPAGRTSAFLSRLGGEERLGIPPPSGQARLELERQRLQCDPSGVIEPC